MDRAIFGLNPIGYSLHNILWFAALIIAAGFLMQRAVPGRISSLAIVIFSISGIHWYVVYWTAARHIIVAASIGLWSLLAYTKWREQGWKKGRIISILGILLVLLAGEASLGVLAYFFAYELLATDDALKQKLKNLLPFIILTISYLIVYKSFGYGASAGSGYLNPLTEPLRFLLAFPGRFLALAGSMIAGGHTELWMFPSIRLRRPKPFLKKGFRTPKNFLLRWFLLSFFLRVPSCFTVSSWLKLGGGFGLHKSLDIYCGLWYL